MLADALGDLIVVEAGGRLEEADPLHRVEQADGSLEDFIYELAAAIDRAAKASAHAWSVIDAGDNYRVLTRWDYPRRR